MKVRLLLVMFLVSATVAVAQRQVSASPDHVGKPLGNLDADFVVNAPGNLEKRPLLIEFWATWCPPCRKTIPQLNQLHAKYKDQGLVIIGLSDEPADVLQAFVKAQPTHYAIASDPKGRLAKRLGVTFIPFCVVVDAAGKIAWQGSPQMIPEGLIPKVLAEAGNSAAAGDPAAIEGGGGMPPVIYRPGPRPNWY